MRMRKNLPMSGTKRYYISTELYRLYYTNITLKPFGIGIFTINILTCGYVLSLDVMLNELSCMKRPQNVSYSLSKSTQASKMNHFPDYELVVIGMTYSKSCKFCVNISIEVESVYLL